MRKLAVLSLIFLTTLSINLPQLPNPVYQRNSLVSAVQATQYNSHDSSIPTSPDSEEQESQAEYPVLVEDLIHHLSFSFSLPVPKVSKHQLTDDLPLTTRYSRGLHRPPDALYC